VTNKDIKNVRLSQGQSKPSLSKEAFSQLMISSRGPAEKQGGGGGEGWRDGLAVKSTDCSYRRPEFNSQQPQGGSQPSVIRSDALFWCV
jgi:hypothetical protein